VSIKDSKPETALPKILNKELTTLFTGRHCIELDEVDSTNSYLSGYINGNLIPEGSAVRTFHQTGGRGQKGARWHSEAGKNLIQSFAFYPTFLPAKDVFQLNKAFALGVYDFVSNLLGEGVRIKWPNDIYYDSLKIGGLLIENAVYGSRLSSCILGIGININQTVFPAELHNPASFSTIKQKTFNLETLFASLCSFLEKRYLNLKSGGVQIIEKDYLAVLYGLGELKKFQSGGEIFHGVIRGVNESGKLVVQREDGREGKFDIKEIVFL
jgi:BirA family transcriptional regulator, biotin operon repressor / biotin---[acetyl-CoA-carboxylase] ligase